MFFSNNIVSMISGGTSVDKINETSQLYHTIAFILIVVAIVFFIITVFIWFKMNIRHEIIVLTGIGVQKEVARIEKRSKRETEGASSNVQMVKRRSGIVPNSEIMDNNITQNLSDRKTTPLRQTVPIKAVYVNNDSPETMPINSMKDIDETVLLENNVSKSFDNNSSFVVEKDEVYISNNKQ